MHGMVSPMRRRARALFGAVVLLGFFSLGGFDQGARAQTPLDRLPAYLKNFPNFNKALTSPFPGDVDTALQQRLAKEKKFAEIQRLFDLDAWQMFVAVNWPTNNEGHAAPKITDTAFGPPHWTLWQASSQVYRVDGQRPIACGIASPAAALAAAAQRPAPLLRGLALMQRPAGVDPRAVLLLGNLSAVGNISILNLKSGEINQAFTGPPDRSERQFRPL